MRQQASDVTALDPGYLRYQYGDAEKLRIRHETHRLYTDGAYTFVDDLLQHLALRPGLRLLDVGCGPGSTHQELRRRGVHVLGLDASFGMVREARAAASPDPRSQYVQGDAQALPLPEGRFHRVTALHMLYHVPDRAQALAEMRRVLRPGGRLVLSTIGADTMQRLMEVHADAALTLGYSPTPAAGRFTLDDLPLVRSVFPTAVRHIVESALVFHAAEPAVRFYATNRIDSIRGAPADGSHRAQLLPLVRAKIERIIAAEGVFRVPKTAGFFVADV
jgi:ubiquinone/menaquinone biosynthesis C-methylase UbiE